MKITIQVMKRKMEFFEKRNFRSETGYAFVDECGYCHIVVYGEVLRKIYEKILIK